MIGSMEMDTQFNHPNATQEANEQAKKRTPIQPLYSTLNNAAYNMFLQEKKKKAGDGLRDLTRCIHDNKVRKNRPVQANHWNPYTVTLLLLANGRRA